MRELSEENEESCAVVGWSLLLLAFALAPFVAAWFA